MARAAREILGSLVVEECVVSPWLPEDAPEGWIQSTHPKLSEASERAARALLSTAASAKGQILALISGGGSALAALPAAGLSLRDKAELVEQVYAAGADIDDLNAVRKHLSAFKGGRLAEAASVPVITLLVSDVVGDDLSTVASGPTLPDPSTYADALRIVEERLGSEASGPALLHLQAGALGEHSETPKQARSGDRQVLLAGIGALAGEAQALAEGAGTSTHLISSQLEGDVDSVAQGLLDAATEKGLWIACGEATIELPADPGQGGRAQQLALRMAREIRARSDIQVLVAGSDGVDGNSEAAGALVDGDTWDRLIAMGIDPEESLQRCDAGTALAAAGAQITTGPTGVNHADLILIRVG
jgi:hydroxypyruvate reductase